jgi:hypothetical protein
MRPSLPKGQVAAKHRDTSADQGVGERHEERARRGGAGAVGEDEADLGASGWRVERAPNGQSVADVLVKRSRRRRRGIARPQCRAPVTARSVTAARTREME